MSKKILIVDDETDVLKTAKTILKNNKYTIETAKNGAEALDAIKKSRFDLILLDIMMPTLSGYDVLRLLKEKVTNKTKIAYLTIVPKNDVDLSMVNGFIQKPYSPQILTRKFASLTKN